MLEHVSPGLEELRLHLVEEDGEVSRWRLCVRVWVCACGRAGVWVYVRVCGGW